MKRTIETILERRIERTSDFLDSMRNNDEISFVRLLEIADREAAELRGFIHGLYVSGELDDEQADKYIDLVHNMKYDCIWDK